MNRRLLKKLINVIATNGSRRLGLRWSLGQPFLMLIDPSNVCNLRCPMCISTIEKGRYKESLFPIAAYRELMDYFGVYLTHLYLYNWGEPFLNRNIYEMIRLAKSFDIHVTVSSNLNLGNPDEIVQSGLDVLVCSLDGATQETYEQYRVGGNLGEALHRAREIVRLKKERGTSKPALIWQYLLFEHNKDEAEAARKMADDIGFDQFFSGAGQVCAEHPVIKPLGGKAASGRAETSPSAPSDRSPENAGPRPLLTTRGESCAWLYSALSVDPLGRVYPCCILWHDAYKFTTLTVTEPRKIFNSVLFREARKHFAARRSGKSGVVSVNEANIQQPTTHCEKCRAFPNTYLFDHRTMLNYFSARMALPKTLERMLGVFMK